MYLGFGVFGPGRLRLAVLFRDSIGRLCRGSLRVRIGLFAQLYLPWLSLPPVRIQGGPESSVLPSDGLSLGSLPGLGDCGIGEMWLEPDAVDR